MLSTPFFGDFARLVPAIITVANKAPRPPAKLRAKVPHVAFHFRGQVTDAAWTACHVLAQEEYTVPRIAKRLHMAVNTAYA